MRMSPFAAKDGAMVNRQLATQSRPFRLSARYSNGCRSLRGHLPDFPSPSRYFGNEQSVSIGKRSAFPSADR